MSSDMRELLRQLNALAGPYLPFDTAVAPRQPEVLFAEWLRMAIDAGIREPHAMTLSTVDADGRPDARILILKDVDEHGWHFAIARNSPKGQQLAHSPQVALTFYWPLLGRQVRIRGEALDRGVEYQISDFLARPAASRAVALLGRQSEILANEQDLADGLAQQQQRLVDHPDLVAPQWAVYAVKAHSIEFWQGDEQRRHTRLRYVREDHKWRKERLWP
ncbi:pyridoxal 5'-phosphate synthase [Pantoea sp. B65]|uniref:pyridoxine/pyridoxamine 5'-phosphate oxidase n=1 Tax=Pantoea sp. B65 TaxID=2813359 RepID=UPI0039B3FDAD